MDRWSNTRTKPDERGVSGAMGVPTVEAHPAETPVEDDPETNMEQDAVPNDVEMDFVGTWVHREALAALSNHPTMRSLKCSLWKWAVQEA